MYKSDRKTIEQRVAQSPNPSSVFMGLLLTSLLSACGSEPPAEPEPQVDSFMVSRSDYADRLEGFWLGQSIANWTGIITELDKIGGDGPEGEFYTREDWGGPDQPNIYVTGTIAPSTTIDWVFEDEDSVWGADDDTDIEYIYQYLMLTH